MNWLLDTDVLSQLAKSKGDPRVIRWIEEQQTRSYTSAIVIAQIARWIRTKEGRNRAALQDWFTKLLDAMQGRVYGFGVSVAIVWADLQYKLEAAGQRMPLEDSYIAATALRHGLIIATGNMRHFRRLDLKVFDPFRE